MREWYLNALPMPPSSNNQYVSFQRHGKICHVPSKDLVTYRQAMEAWQGKNAEYCLRLRAEIGEAAQRSTLAVSARLLFHRRRLYTLEGKPKKLDASNRAKALHDELA